MPYVPHEKRAALDVMIDGLVAKIREHEQEEDAIRYAALKCIVEGQNRYLEDLAEFLNELRPVDGTTRMVLSGLIQRLHNIHANRGDVNYTLTRIVLESMKPEGGWGYHTLSDCVALMNNVADILIRCMDGDDLIDLLFLVSIPRDVATEIERRLLGPYEDTAILKNGDMACFQEPFAHCPVPECDMVQEKTRDAYNAYAASWGGCPPPPGYNSELPICAVAEELENQLLASLENDLETLQGAHSHQASIGTVSELKQWEDDNDYAKRVRTYKIRIAEIKAEKSREG